MMANMCLANRNNTNDLSPPLDNSKKSNNNSEHHHTEYDGRCMAMTARETQRKYMQ